MTVAKGPAEPFSRAREVRPGVHLLEVPTPFAVGSINAYLLDGEPLTLVDNGPDIASSFYALRRLIGETGHDIRDLERIVVTHHHIDHLGLTALLAEVSGAEVAAFDLAADIVEDFERKQAANDLFARSLMMRNGLDPHVADALRSVAALISGLGNSAAVDTRYAVGEQVRFGDREFTVLHRPGHSPTDTVFYSDGVLLSGDHLLSEISSNALITRDWDGGEGARTRPLLDYRRSLVETREMDVEIVLGGHGPTHEHPRELIDGYLDNHLQRAEKIHELLKIRPMSAHEIASAIWAKVAFTQAFLTLSEVIGHLDLLVDEGLVVADESAEIVSFQCA